MTQEPDYYAILQVDVRAEKEVIDAAYRRLAAKYHPDVNCSADATERMQRINAAYHTLSDPRRRAEYDRARSRAHSTSGPSPQPTDRAQDVAGQAWYFFKWALFLFILGEAFQRMGARGVVVVLVLGGLLWLLLKSRQVF